MFARPGLLVVVSGALISASPVPLPPQYLPILGGAGGSGFTRSCGAGNVVTGLQFREGMVVDAIGVMCRPVSQSGALGAQQASGSLAGGGGGTSGTVSCPSGQVITRMRIAFGSFVDGIAIYCARWNASTRQYDAEGAFVTNYIARDDGVFSSGAPTQRCDSRAQPVNGIRGRASGVVDAIGIICDEP
jgi:hypothetical protein